jgi:hypothetical protein
MLVEQQLHSLCVHVLKHDKENNIDFISINSRTTPAPPPPPTPATTTTPPTTTATALTNKQLTCI